MATAATSVARKHQVATVLRRTGTVELAPPGSCATGACAGVIAPPTGMRTSISAETRASSAVTSTAGRQPQPRATHAPTASGPTSPIDDPTPLASVNAADDA